MKHTNDFRLVKWGCAGLLFIFMLLIGGHSIAANCHQEKRITNPYSKKVGIANPDQRDNKNVFKASELGALLF